MTMLQNYLANISKLHFQGNATEHSYRSDLQLLLQEILGKEFSVVNEPTRQKCGAPDYIISKKEVPVGYVEAKDLKLGIDHKKNKEQFDRYRKALDNLIITDYLHFEFYRNGELKAKIALGEILMNEIVPHEKNFESFIHLIKDFGQEVSQTIKNSEKLAEMMANKALLMADVIHNALDEDDLTEKNTELVQQRTAFKDMLIHDIDNQLFADLYSQTIAYGLFVARYHDPSLPTFDRIEAANLIPKSNPFLRKLFQHIAGFDLDVRLKWIVEELVQIFLASDVKDIMKNFGKSTRQEDPVIHFYETFLGKYNPKLRKSRGVWYTPQPVVQFIVRAVDDLLKSEFGLSQGLADTSKIKKKVDYLGKKVDKEFHKVQVLDPATGTGTFLAETIKHIYEENFKNINEGIWPQYVEKDLIPRINGFELLMASYSMAHLKLDMLLSETGYETNQDQRFNIFLTNSLEEHHKDTGTLFASWLSDESTLANQIKKDTPVMCVIGNPPYSVSSSNKSDWIENLLKDYKKNLNERNIQPLSDDYIKFIRFGQHFVDKNGEGILAYISNNSFVDGIIHRQMRRSLLESFDKIYILDLHGNSKKKETAPDGSADQNVFDIMQGVSINLFVKTKQKKKGELGKLYQYDLQGKRSLKYDFLNNNSIKSIDWNLLKNLEPNLFFIDKNYEGIEIYNEGFKIDDFFVEKTSGVKTHDDNNLVNFSDFNNEYNQKYYYRPFDLRNINYDLKKVLRHRFSVMKNMLKDNISILTCKQQSTFEFQHALITKNLSDMCSVSLQTKETTYAFPLYLYQEPTALDERERIPNFNPKILAEIEAKLGMKCVDTGFDDDVILNEVKHSEESIENNKDFSASLRSAQNDKTFSPLNLLDYIYAVLHSPKYRETYKEFLKIDFPRVPYPKRENFWQLADLGSQIRKLHLLEDISNKDLQTRFPVAGSSIVEKPHFETVTKEGMETSSPKVGKVYINDTQYFENVPETAWNFYIGGYQPAQKWLKDRKGRTLSFDDVLHYQKMIFALTETDELMGEIDRIMDL